MMKNLQVNAIKYFKNFQNKFQKNIYKNFKKIYSRKIFLKIDKLKKFQKKFDKIYSGKNSRKFILEKKNILFYYSVIQKFPQEIQ